MQNDEQDRRAVRLIDASKVGEILGCSSRHVWALYAQGRLCHPVRIGRLTRWRTSDLEDWISGLPQGGAPMAARRAPQKRRRS